MTRAQLRTELQATGFGTDSASVTRQNNWLDAAYTWVWNARDPQGAAIRWGFQYIDQATLAVVGAMSQPVMPADFGDAEWIMDGQGAEIRELPPDKFDALFAPDNAAGRTGQPFAYKVLNRQVVLGPTPQASATFRWTYKRRVSHYETNGTTVDPGTLDNDADIPLWPADHHMILVYHAAAIGHALNSNPAAITMEGLRDDALTAMRADLEAEFAPAQTWGDGGWQAWGM